jgi:hypothetical protein
LHVLMMPLLLLLLQVLQGMLWVFADSTPEGWAAATAADSTPGDLVMATC